MNRAGWFVFFYSHLKRIPYSSWTARCFHMELRPHIFYCNSSPVPRSSTNGKSLETCWKDATFFNMIKLFFVTIYTNLFLTVYVGIRIWCTVGNLLNRRTFLCWALCFKVMMDWENCFKTLETTFLCVFEQLNTKWTSFTRIFELHGTTTWTSS